MPILVATEYEILRDVPASSRLSVPLARTPKRVCTVVDEQRFLASGGAMVHHETVFFEEKNHDWDWQEGRLSYYSRVYESGEKAPAVLVVYQEEYREPIATPDTETPSTGPV